MLAIIARMSEIVEISSTIFSSFPSERQTDLFCWLLLEILEMNDHFAFAVERRNSPQQTRYGIYETNFKSIRLFFIFFQPKIYECNCWWCTEQVGNNRNVGHDNGPPKLHVSSKTSWGFQISSVHKALCSRHQMDRRLCRTSLLIVTSALTSHTG